MFALKDYGIWLQATYAAILWPKQVFFSSKDFLRQVYQRWYAFGKYILSVCLSIYQSICLSIYLSIILFLIFIEVLHTCAEMPTIPNDGNFLQIVHT